MSRVRKLVVVDITPLRQSRDFRYLYLGQMASFVARELTVVAVPQWLSKKARMEVLRSHVAEIAQIAASVVDGDLHRQLLDAANYTPELYERVDLRIQA